MDRRPSTPSCVEQFVGNYKLSNALDDNCGTPFLKADEPAMLASFIAFCKGRRVYLRGETRWHRELLPSLFREADGPGGYKGRWDAYRDFVLKLKNEVKGTRFTRHNFGAVLQHYGFQTPWIDVLDDIHTAAWFALHERHDGDGSLVEYRRIDTAAFGWVVVLAVPKDIRRQDLRLKQSSRNTRCHVQQGFSLAMQRDDDALKYEQDFAEYVVGRVRIPNCKRWNLHGFRASPEYLFPSSEIDDTYKQLLTPPVAKLAEETECKYGLEPETLGRVVKHNKENTELQGQTLCVAAKGKV